MWCPAGVSAASGYICLMDARRIFARDLIHAGQTIEGA
jgi:hypothetical protein